MCPWSPGSHLIRNGASTKDNFKMGGGAWMWSFPRAAACSQSDTVQGLCKGTEVRAEKDYFSLPFPSRRTQTWAWESPWAQGGFSTGLGLQPLSWGLGLAALRVWGRAKVRWGKRGLFSLVRPDQGGAGRGSVACAVPLLEALTAPGIVCSQGTENTSRGGDGEQGRTSQGS